MGTFYSGLKANTLDIAPNYAGVVMAVANGVGGLTGVVGPYVVGLLTPNVCKTHYQFIIKRLNTFLSLLQSLLTEWRLVFWLTFVIFVVTTIIYITFASGDIQTWNEPPTKTSNKIFSVDVTVKHDEKKYPEKPV